MLYLLRKRFLINIHDERMFGLLTKQMMSTADGHKPIARDVIFDFCKANDKKQQRKMPCHNILFLNIQNKNK